MALQNHAARYVRENRDSGGERADFMPSTVISERRKLNGATNGHQTNGHGTAASNGTAHAERDAQFIMILDIDRVFAADELIAVRASDPNKQFAEVAA